MQCVCSSCLTLWMQASELYESSKSPHSLMWTVNIRMIRWWKQAADLKFVQQTSLTHIHYRPSPQIWMNIEHQSKLLFWFLLFHAEKPTIALTNAPNANINTHFPNFNYSFSALRNRISVSIVKSKFGMHTVATLHSFFIYTVAGQRPPKPPTES